MKTERRHELQSNVLADWIGKSIINLRQYSRAIVGVLIAVCVIFFASTYILGSRSASNSKAWNLYFNATIARNSEALESVAETYSNSSAGLWARLSLADLQLDNGSRLSYTRLGGGEEDLKNAVNHYTSVLSDAQQKGHDMIQRRALFGLGLAYESLNDAEIAIKQYGLLFESWPDSALGKAAGKRLSHLSNPATQEFYAWYAQQDLRTRPRPMTNTGFQFPQNYSDLPDAPNLTLPNPADLSFPSSDLSSEQNDPELGNADLDSTDPSETKDEKEENSDEEPTAEDPAPLPDSNSEDSKNDNSSDADNSSEKTTSDNNEAASGDE